jgi:hypothetical protein
MKNTTLFSYFFFSSFTRSTASEALWARWLALPTATTTAIAERALSKVRADRVLALPLVLVFTLHLGRLRELGLVLGPLGLDPEVAAVAPTPALHPRQT